MYTNSCALPPKPHFNRDVAQSRAKWKWKTMDTLPLPVGPALHNLTIAKNIETEPPLSSVQQDASIIV